MFVGDTCLCFRNFSLRAAGSVHLPQPACSAAHWACLFQLPWKLQTYTKAFGTRCSSWKKKKILFSFLLWLHIRGLWVRPWDTFRKLRRELVEEWALGSSLSSVFVLKHEYSFVTSVVPNLLRSFLVEPDSEESYELRTRYFQVLFLSVSCRKVQEKYDRFLNGNLSDLHFKSLIYLCIMYTKIYGSMYKIHICDTYIRYILDVSVAQKIF